MSTRISIIFSYAIKIVHRNKHKTRNEIPKTWKWVRLENAIEVIPSKRYQVLESEVHEEGLYPVISQAHEFYIGYSDDTTKVFHPSSPVVLFGDHTVEIKIVNSDFVVGADGVKIFSPKQGLFPSFLYYVLQYLCTNLNKIGGYSRHYKFIKNKQIPLPPLSEQKRIVAKIEELMPMLDQYELAWTKLDYLDSRFPSDIQKSILQEAMQGRLVEQRPEEGSAKELYCQIQEEKERLVKEGKIKKEKPLPEITEEEEPFEIPKTWKWVRLGEIIKLISGVDLDASKYDQCADGIPYITGASNFKGQEIIFNRWTKNPTRIAHCGDLLLTCKGTIGKTSILEVNEAHIARQVMALRPIFVNTLFLQYFIKSQIKHLNVSSKSFIPGIDRDSILNLVVPLPPLEEQERIVNKLDELLALCSKLESRS